MAKKSKTRIFDNDDFYIMSQVELILEEIVLQTLAAEPKRKMWIIHDFVKGMRKKMLRANVDAPYLW